MWVQGPKHLDHLWLLFQEFGRELVWKWSSLDSDGRPLEMFAPQVAANPVITQYWFPDYGLLKIGNMGLE